jgi:uncharacterized membrane protein
MLVPIPIGLFVFSLVGDIAVWLGYDGAWPEVAFYCIGGGIVGALLAAVFGLIDLTGLRSDKASFRVGLTHMGVNLVVVGLYVFNFGMRWQDHAAGGGAPMLLSLIAIVLLLVSGWLGGHMVYVRGVAVRPLAGERRKVQVPVRVERRRAPFVGGPIGQH